MTIEILPKEPKEWETLEDWQDHVLAWFLSESEGVQALILKVLYDNGCQYIDDDFVWSDIKLGDFSIGWKEWELLKIMYENIKTAGDAAKFYKILTATPPEDEE